MNRRRRFLAKRKRSVAKALADACSAHYLSREDRDTIQTFWTHLNRGPHGFAYVSQQQAAILTAVRDR